MLCMAYCRLKRNLPGLNLIELEKEAVSWQSMVPEAAIPSKKFMKMAGSLAGAFLLLLICKWGWFGYAVDKRITKGKSMIELAEQLKKEESGLLQLSRTNIDYAGLFLYLAETLPKDTIVKNISLDSKTGVEFSLVGGNNQKVLEILAKLNSSDFFRDVGTERAVVEKDGFVVYLKGKLKTGS